MEQTLSPSPLLNAATTWTTTPLLHAPWGPWLWLIHHKKQSQCSYHPPWLTAVPTGRTCCVKGAEQWITFFDWGRSGKSMIQRPWKFQRVAWSPWIWQSFLGEVSLPLEECKIGWWDVEDDSLIFLGPVGTYSRGERKTLQYQQLQSP